MANNYADLSTGTVLAAPAPAGSGTSLTLQSGEGDDMPATPFFATSHPDYTYPTKANSEIVKVTNVATDTLTIVRGQKGTSGKDIAIGWRLSAGIYASDIEQYQIDDVYITTNSTNPATRLGYGTWIIFGAGKVLIGLDSSDVDFDTSEEVGGAKTHTLTEDEMPAHTHNAGNTFNAGAGGSSLRTQATGVTATSSTGGGSAHTIVQPYVVVYMWKRTA